MEIEKIESSFSAVSCNNEQLIHPSSIDGREKVISDYIAKGYAFFNVLPGNRLVQYMSLIKSKIPKRIKRYIKKHMQ